jgi:hypothetical protein
MLTFFPTQVYYEICHLKNDLRTNARLDPAQKLILIIRYHNIICKAYFDLSESHLKQLRKRLALSSAHIHLQNRRYHFTEAVHTASWLANLEQGIQILEEAVNTIYPTFYRDLQLIETLKENLLQDPSFSDWDWVADRQEDSEPLYWYWWCRKADPVAAWCYKQQEEQRPAPSDCDNPWKLLSLHAYFPGSPLCARYPLFEVTGATVSESLKAFVEKKGKKDAEDLKYLSHVWGDPDLTQVDRLYIQEYLAIDRSSALPSSPPRSPPPSYTRLPPPNTHSVMATHTLVSLPLPVLPGDWSGEKDFKPIASLSAATQRSIEPVGPHFLAHARRARHKRTFSEDDRIQAQENVKKVEDDDSGEITEPEDSMMLSRDAKDWKVCTIQV